MKNQDKFTSRRNQEAPDQGMRTRKVGKVAKKIINYTPVSTAAMIPIAVGLLSTLSTLFIGKNELSVGEAFERLFFYSCLALVFLVAEATVSRRAASKREEAEKALEKLKNESVLLAEHEGVKNEAAEWERRFSKMEKSVEIYYSKVAPLFGNVAFEMWKLESLANFYLRVDTKLSEDEENLFIREFEEAYIDFLKYICEKTTYLFSVLNGTPIHEGPFANIKMLKMPENGGGVATAVPVAKNDQSGNSVRAEDLSPMRADENFLYVQFINDIRKKKKNSDIYEVVPDVKDIVKKRDKINEDQEREGRPKYKRPRLGCGYESFILVPLIGSKSPGIHLSESEESRELIGTMCVDSSKVGYFKKQDVSFMRQFAYHAVSANNLYNLVMMYKGKR